MVHSTVVGQVHMRACLGAWCTGHGRAHKAATGGGGKANDRWAFGHPSPFGFTEKKTGEAEGEAGGAGSGGSAGESGRRGGRRVVRIGSPGGGGPTSGGDGAESARRWQQHTRAATAATRARAVPELGWRSGEVCARRGGAGAWGSRRRGQGGSGATVAVWRRRPWAEERRCRRWRSTAAEREKGGGGWNPRVVGLMVTRLPKAGAYRSGDEAARRHGRELELGFDGFSLEVLTEGEGGEKGGSRGRLGCFYSRKGEEMAVGGSGGGAFAEDGHGSGEPGTRRAMTQESRDGRRDEERGAPGHCAEESGAR